jgi:hypothetical protein
VDYPPFLLDLTPNVDPPPIEDGHLPMETKPPKRTTLLTMLMVGHPKVALERLQVNLQNRTTGHHNLEID